MSGAGEKTEKPTARRIQEARQKGQVAKSMDLNSALVVGSMVGMMAMYGPYAFYYIVRVMRQFLSQDLKVIAHLEVFNDTVLLKLIISVALHLFLLISPFLLVTMIIGVLINLFQIKPLFTLEPLKPSFGKLNVIEGFKRIFSQRSVVELVKGIIKIVVTGLVCYWVVQGKIETILMTSHMSLGQAMSVIGDTVFQMSMALFCILLVLGLGDWWFQVYQLMKQLKMSRQEIRDEFRNSEGNPDTKRKMKQVGNQLAKQRMMKNIPAADVVVTNPTHISVALKYDPDLFPAPIVVAKGADHLAFKIREVAKEHGVPILENKPLARSLYKSVDIEKMVPPELFVAVAEVLAIVFTKNKGRKKRSWVRQIPGVPSVRPVQRKGYEV